MVSGVVSVVPTYCPGPNLGPLVENLAANGHVLVSDDASPATSDPYVRAVGRSESVEIIRHRHNFGVARGLNDGLHHAQHLGARWLLTVDQDTSIGADYVSILVESAQSLESSGMEIGVHSAGIVEDESGLMDYAISRCGIAYCTPEVIQSGSLWSVKALTDIGGFRESFRSDAVDAAACLALREQGFAVTINPSLKIRHRIGSARQTSLFGHRIMVTHHPRDRFVSMIRNRAMLFPRELRTSPAHAVRTIRRVSVNATLSWLSRNG